MTSITILRTNPWCQIQDLGRFGGAPLGLSQGGVLDETSARLANALVGNDKTAALLEIGLGSIQLRTSVAVMLALTGAKMPLFINGRQVANYQNIWVDAGSQIDIGYSVAGSRGYLAFAGGIEAPLILQSKATVLRERIGGLAGLPLTAGQTLTIAARSRENSTSISVPYQFHRKSKGLYNIPYVLGAQADQFGIRLINQIERQIYRITSQSDRMGMRLQGYAVQPPNTSSLLSEGITLGAIQLPPDGQPIIMLNDHQTIGGYAKIGAVTRLGVSTLGQCRPGDLIRFAAVSLEQAREKALRHEQWLLQLEQKLRAGTI